jgi:hypothetical protein
VLSLYPDAGEAGGCFRPSLRQRSTHVPGVPAADPERARAEAARRARGKVRRYCAANRLNRMGTLTYQQGCHDVRQVRQDVGVFFRALRAQMGRPFAYLWVPEWHKTHGLHVHFGVGRFIARSKIVAAWDRVDDAGWVHIKLIGDLPVGSGSLAEARVTAGYLGKYVSKSFEDRPEKGLNRYDCAQGFQPGVRRLSGRSAWDVVAQACDLMGAMPAVSWSSGEVEDWRAAPAVWMQWS